MANNKMTGIIFSNSHDDALGGLTARRSMGSVPFASRYRLIDLVLSRMSHAGVDSVALVMQNNYHSLMEHIGSGKEWDLSRKRGGIAYFPPYSSAGSAGYSRGTLESMTSLLGYLQSSSADYIAVSDCDVICGVDLSDVLEYHIAHKAGITLICTEHGHSSVMVSAGEDGRLLEATRGGEGDLMFNNMYIVNRELLDHARRKTTQKVNLYEKVQIPGYEDAIRKIKRFMEDEENLSKSAQKIVKTKQQQAGEGATL